jgi:hypothetical protein
VAGRSPSGAGEEPFVYRAFEPSRASAFGIALLAFVVFLANGRPIESGDTRSLARAAASLASELDFDLDEYPDVEFPFARESGGHKWSIYPALPALMASPVFLASRLVFELNEEGSDFAGKVAASLFAAAACALFYLALGRRHPHGDARWAAVVLALGTSLWSTSQALWQHPAAVLWLCLALLFIVRAEEDESWAARAGLPLALMVAARHADVALGAVLTAGILLRWPRQALRFALWAAPVAAALLVYQWGVFGAPWRHGFSGSLGRFSEAWGAGQLGLLVSPGKGLLVFTPVAIVGAVGLVRAARGERWLASTLGAAFVAHLVFTGRWREWHGGECFGPRLMTDAVPLLLFFAPEGLAKLQWVGALLAGVSIGVQALGAFAYDGRWERLFQREAAPREARGFAEHPELWSWKWNPIVFHAARRVIEPSVPSVLGGRLSIRPYPVVLFGPSGSRFSFGGDFDEVTVKGADATAGDVHLQRGALCEENRLRLRGRWDALFLRVRPVARMRKLELRVAGRGNGPLYVVERSPWGPQRVKEYAASGAFRIRHPYEYAESGGADLLVTTGRGGAVVSLDSVALVAPGDPEAPLQVP